MRTRVLFIIAILVGFFSPGRGLALEGSKDQAVFREPTVSIGACTAILEEVLPPCPDKGEQIQQCCQDQHDRNACIIGHLTPEALERLGSRFAALREEARLKGKLAVGLFIVALIGAVSIGGMLFLRQLDIVVQTPGEQSGRKPTGS